MSKFLLFIVFIIISQASYAQSGSLMQILLPKNFWLSKETEDFTLPHVELKIKLPKGFKKISDSEDGPRDLTLRIDILDIDLIGGADRVCGSDGSGLALAQKEILKRATTDEHANLAITFTDLQTYQAKLHDGPVKIAYGMTTCFGYNADENEDPPAHDIDFKSIFFKGNYRIQIGFWSVPVSSDVTESVITSRIKNFSTDPGFSIARPKWEFFERTIKSVFGKVDSDTTKPLEQSLILGLKDTKTNKYSTFLIEASDNKKTIYGPFENIVLLKNESLIEIGKQKMCQFQYGNSKEFNSFYLQKNGEKKFFSSSLIPCEEIAKRSTQDYNKRLAKQPSAAPIACVPAMAKSSFCNPNRICESTDYDLTYIDEVIVATEVRQTQNSECLVMEENKVYQTGWNLKKVWKVDDSTQEQLSYESVYGEYLFHSLNRKKSRQYKDGKWEYDQFDCPMIENWGVRYIGSSPVVEDKATWKCGANFKFGDSDNYKSPYPESPMSYANGYFFGDRWNGQALYSQDNEYKVTLTNSEISLYLGMSRKDQFLAKLSYGQESNIVMAIWNSGVKSKKVIKAFDKRYNLKMRENIDK